MAEPARWATPDDDAALRALCLATPMRGGVSYTLEREPDFFALTRLQGDAGGRVAVIMEGDAVVAMTMMAPMRVWLGGEVRQSAYLGDLKVHPSHRNAGLAGRVLHFLGEELQRAEISYSSFLVLTGNPMVPRMESGEAFFGAERLCAIRNYFILFGSPAGPAKVTVTRASPEALPEMIELWNRVNGKRSFAPVLDEALFARWLGSTLALEDFRLVRRGGRIVAFGAAWDASALKQIRLLRLTPALRVSTAAYNLYAAALRRPRFPPAGQHLRFLYLAHVCAESPEDLEALVAHVHDEHRHEGYLYLDLALDRADPLTAALRPFRSMKLDFDLWAARTPGAHAATPTPLADPCAYFDMSLV
jgi:hypothetical protein